MIADELTSAQYPERVCERPRVSVLATVSLVFAALGPMSAAAVWILSFNDFWDAAHTVVIAVFSFGPAWALGLILGVKALERIRHSQGRLMGTEYALAATYIAAAWILFILAALVFPAIFYVNS